jgi:hypothetical protein
MVMMVPNMSGGTSHMCVVLTNMCVITSNN